MPELASIVYRPMATPRGDTAFTRLPLREALLIVGYGIEGDAKGGAGNRHLNILSAASLRTLEEEGFKTAPGAMGEQLIVDGIAVEELPSGTKLAIGETAVAEVVELRTGCAIFERNQGKPREQAAKRLGVMATVVTSGAIRIGDTVRVLPAAVD